MNINRCLFSYVRVALCMAVALELFSASEVWAVHPRARIFKKVACVPENADCSSLAETDYKIVKTGFKTDTQLPAFCYQIMVTNVTESTIEFQVTDDQLDLSLCTFPSSLGPGETATCYVLAQHEATTTNTATVLATLQGQARFSTNTATAIANVLTASIRCAKTVSSPDDTDGHPDDNQVTLPADGSVHAISYGISVTNTGESALRRIMIDDPQLVARGCPAPRGFTLAAGGSTNLSLCTINLSCIDLPLNNQVTVTAEVRPLMGECGRDITGAPATVSSTCDAVVRCQTQRGDDDDDDDDDDDNHDHHDGGDHHGDDDDGD